MQVSYASDTYHLSIAKASYAAAKKAYKPSMFEWLKCLPLIGCIFG